MTSTLQRTYDDLTVVIPAAGPVPEGLVALSNISCPAMVPVAGRPVIHWTLRYLISLGIKRFVIAVAQRGLYIEDFVECTFGSEAEVEFVVPSRDGGVGLTLKELLDRVTTPRALAVLGDTHFQLRDASMLASDTATVLVHPVEESHRWCIARVDESGAVTSLHDKEPGLPFPLQALIGVYFFPEASVAREAATAAVEAAAKEGRARSEISAVLRGVGAIRAEEADDWLDVGNPDRQASSHRTLLQKRAFNDLEIDPVFGTITKRSRHVEKFVDEINYLRLLPPDLAVLFPRVLGFSTDWNAPELTMEYYGYPSLSEVFVFENVDPSTWEGVFAHLFEVITRGFMRHARPLPSSALRYMTVDKTRDRVAMLKSGEAPHEVLCGRQGKRINGAPHANLEERWPAIEAQVRAMAEGAQAGVVHGDLCLSNILYDLRSRIVKLVDPRGSFGTAGLFGDPRYDVAKLYHSVYGLYDFIVNDLFRVETGADEVTLEIRTRPYHREILERFEKVFFPTFDRREILLLTGLLFASMPSLHYDKPRRQLAMSVRALQLLAEATEST